MKYTANFGLKKPDDGDFGSNDDLNYNFDTIDAHLASVKNGSAIINVTVSKVIALTDAGTLQKCNSADAIDITVPTNASVAFPVNVEIVLVRFGVGTVKILGASGVTIYSSESKRSINKQYEAVTLKKIATNEWLLIGALSA